VTPTSPRAPRTATIVLVTRNRKDLLESALRSATAQVGDVDVLVIDDGSTDGTHAMVAERFPEVTCHRHVESQGLVVRRNEAARLARGDILVSLDDDAVFTSPDTVRQTLADFDHPRIAAVAIPYVDVLRSDACHQQPPDAEGRWIAATFRGTAYAVRRDAFLQLGGFREVIFHQGEEPDFTLRLLDAGGLVRLGRGGPVHHFEAADRDVRRMTFYGRRNEILLCTTRLPMPWNLLASAGFAAKGIRWGVRIGDLRTTLAGIAAGTRLSWRLRRERAPVSRTTYRLDRRLRREGALELTGLDPPASVR
jgi:GT2 family glycosyltransferase